MNIDKPTLEVLSNFSKINTGLLFYPGNKLKTVHSHATTPIVEVEFANVEFPKEVAIHNLPQLLSVLSLFDQPELDFADTLQITDSTTKQSAQIKYADRKVIQAADYSKSYKFPTVDLQFDLSEQNYEYITKAARTLGSPEIAIIGEKDKVYLTTYDHKNSSVDSFRVEVSDNTTDKTFTLIINALHFMFLKRDYRVTVSFKGLMNFVSENEHNTITYWLTFTEKSRINA